jgi:peptidoglycan/xylan/chitin deacetylase (PgdA/CDA1 family)
VRAFIRRLSTVFTRFGISDAKTHRSLALIMSLLRRYEAAPTFFIPAIVLRRHVGLLREMADNGCEVGIHGYVHNDYRFLSRDEQQEQTKRAIAAFEEAEIPFHGFRNPYLGWTEETVAIFAALGFSYDSNEAVLHDVLDISRLSPTLQDSYKKSLSLFQAVECTAFTLRPHYEGALVRIPTSIPDDEMLCDRLRLDPGEIGRVWRSVMQHVYDLGGIYVLNLHPERGVLCHSALASLLNHAHTRALPVWIARLEDVAEWWKERGEFRLTIMPAGPSRWQVDATCTPRATLLARHVVIEGETTTPWFGQEMRVLTHHFIVRANRCPCVAVSDQTPEEVLDFLREEGYAAVRASEGEVDMYALYLDIPDGLGGDRGERYRCCSAVMKHLEQSETPLVRFGVWPEGCRATLSITGDIDSVTMQDFFFRILEVA